MTARSDVTPAATWVAVDIAKRHHAVLIETPDGKQQRFRMASTHEDHQRLVDLLNTLPRPARIAMEPTGDCHRTLAFRLLQEGFCCANVSEDAVDITHPATRMTSPVSTFWRRQPVPAPGGLQAHHRRPLDSPKSDRSGLARKTPARSPDLLRA